MAEVEDSSLGLYSNNQKTKTATRLALDAMENRIQVTLQQPVTRAGGCVMRSEKSELEKLKIWYKHEMMILQFG